MLGLLFELETLLFKSELVSGGFFQGLAALELLCLHVTQTKKQVICSWPSPTVGEGFNFLSFTLLFFSS